ncbi:hypothetical protein FACS1894160_3510 [Bacteroidia bacterium]|nr:hypothetical protein FACS1894123_06220 [Bacteroidia bacterium]GHV08730.1 hypothetical protein FACS1894160_3510 [Bacteroidia bacterium]
MKNSNELIINEIAKQFTDKKRIVTYLMDLLCIGKESVYRRINNQIPFTFQEIVTVAQDLGFSIDKALTIDMERRVFFDMPVNIAQSPNSIFIDKLEQGNIIMEKLINAKELNIIAAVNRMPLHLFPFEALFKFDYCLYLNSIGKIPLISRFSDIEIIPQINDLHKKSAYYCNQLKNMTCIIDSMVFSGLIKEIEYFYRLKFISDEDLHILQKELFELFALTETIIRTGESKIGSVYSVYYSHFNLNSACVYYEYDDKLMLQLWIYPESPIVIENNHLMCDIQKRWLDSVIRKSTLISKSNDVMLIEQFRDIYNQISELTKIKL